MGKGRFAQHTRRFADVVREPAVYLAELSTGVLKIGACGNAQGRLMSLQNEAKRVHGATLGRFKVIPAPTVKAAYELETKLVKCMELVARPLYGRREFFDGVTFDRACEMFGLAA
jgi:hypothetical protein